jgi:hypothetical protein
LTGAHFRGPGSGSIGGEENHLAGRPRW